MTLLTSAVDSQVRETSPSLNYGSAVNLSVNGGGSSNDRYSYIAFPVLSVLPLGATILTATLKIYLRNAWSGTNNLTVKRITERWREGTINWNNKPAVDASPTATAAVVSGVDQQEVTFDVAPILQEVADGGKFFGFRIELTQDLTRAIRSAEDPNSSLRPQLELTWSEAPDAPDRLSPDSQVVGNIGEAGMPRFKWRFTDTAGNTQQTAFQVQIDDAPDFVSTTHDSGKVTSDLSEYVPGSSVISDGQTRYWRVRVYDGTDLVSAWSAVAQFNRDDMGTLAITSPIGSTVPELTPPIVWSLTGETQEAYKLELTDVTNPTQVLLWSSGKIFSTANSHTLPPGYLKTGRTYTVRVTVWDTENRYEGADQALEKTITYVRDGTPTQPSTLTAVPTAGSPEVVLTWTRSATPDYWAVKVDGVEIEDRLEGADYFVSGTTYRISWWVNTPRVTSTYEVEAVTQSSPGQPYLHSDGNPTAQAKSEPIGIWLVDPDDSVSVQILGKDAVETDLGENATTFSPIGSKVQVRITDTVRGYEGSVSGLIFGQDKTDFLTLKGRARSKQLRLVYGDISIPITMEDAKVAPTPIPVEGSMTYTVSFSFFQAGPPWPVA
jgi:hypothetical protein